MATDMATKAPTQQVLDLPDLQQGRVEMHFCEMPFIVPFNPPKTLQSYRIEAPASWDRDTGQLITKSLEIFPSVANGFPTRFDAAVLRGLFTIAHRDNDFTDRKFFLTRYELAKLLGLGNDGRTLKRLLKSLQLLSEVRYRLHNVWWDKRNQERKSFDGFGILDRVHIVEGKKGRYRADEEKESFVVFGDKLFESLNSGCVRQIDFNEMNCFKTHVADQTYLLLKKRFHFEHRIEFPLRKYFQFHLGLSSKYNAAQMKNKLKKGILELEDVGLIEPMAYADRFEKSQGRGEWTIVFYRKKQGKIKVTKSDQVQGGLFDDDLIVKDLIDRGVTRSSAVKLAEAFDEEFIASKIEILDWNIANEKAPNRPGGWLSKAIKEDYAAPKDFVPKAQREAEEAAIKKARKERAEAAARKQKLEEEKRAAENAAEEEQWAAIMAYLNGLPATDYEACIEEAIANAVPLARKKARAEFKEGLDGIYIQLAVRSHVAPLLDEVAAE